MRLCITVICCLVAHGLAVPLDVPGPLKNENDTQLIIGEEVMLRIDNKFIWHMEHDLYLEPGSILFSWGSSIKSTRAVEDDSKAIVQDVVGSIDTRGYTEGTGNDAKFNIISNFIQTSREKVVIVDRLNSCLRELDRTTGMTSKYAGWCTSIGYTDGDSDTARFHNPSDILLDERTNKALIVVDDINSALRSVDMSNRYTSTIIQDIDRISRPRSATFDNYDKNILYLTVRFQVVKVTLSDKSVTVIFGDRKPHRFTDGPFHEALLGYWPAEITQIDRNHLAVADYFNHDIRLIDLRELKVTSLCPARHGNETVPGVLECELQFPHALLMHNGSLYVGDNGHIHIFPVQSVPATGKPDTFRPGCEARTITASIEDDETRAKIKLDEDIVLELSAGSHKYVYTDKGSECTVNIEVKEGPGQCPSSISKVASPQTNTAIVELVIGTLFQQVVLPVGRHPYYMKQGNLSCNLNLDIFDADMERRVVFEVGYKYNCAGFNSNAVATKLVSSTIVHNYVYILELCNGVCSREDGVDPAMVCENGTLTVTYPTDLSYGGDVFVIPTSVKQTLTERLIAKGTMMSIVDTTRIPPVVFPIIQPDGSSAKLLLNSSCMNNKVYDAAKDFCA